MPASKYAVDGSKVIDVFAGRDLQPRPKRLKKSPPFAGRGLQPRPKRLKKITAATNIRVRLLVLDYGQNKLSCLVRFYCRVITSSLLPP